MNLSVKNMTQLTLSLLFTAIPVGCGQQSPTSEPALEVEHTVFAYLGEQHIGNVVHRQTPASDFFVAWGRTPMHQWPLGSAAKTQVVPTHENNVYSNGGCSFDVDEDGSDEVVVARGDLPDWTNNKLYWFDEVPNKDSWDEHYIADVGESNYSSPHDIVAYLPDGELGQSQSSMGTSFKAVVLNVSRRDLYLFVVPEDPTGSWNRYHIGTLPSPSQSGIEIADLNDDGNLDVVTGMFWVEAPSDPTDTPWEFHRYGNYDAGDWRWGGMIKHGVADFDGDGDLEIVATEAEIPGARLGLFHRGSDITSEWTETRIDSGLYAPHSLVVIDANQDGVPDVLVGEMTAAGWNFTYNPNPKIYAYINNGSGQFEKSVVYEGWGTHEMRVFPRLYKGKSMVFAADEIQPQKFNDMNTHISYWLIGSK